MTARVRLLFAAGFVAVALASGPARAEPSIWDAARDPNVRRAERALLELERWMLGSQDESVRMGQRRDLLLAAVAMAELRGAAELPDVRLKFVLADALCHPAVGEAERCRDILELALRESPDHPLAADAWMALAEVSDRLGDSKRALEAYEQALSSTWQPQVRAHLYYNRSESLMRHGDLTLAIRDARRAIQLAAVPDLAVLARYGLAVMLERSGDLPSALKEMAGARRIQLPHLLGQISVLELPNVYFIPSYEYYYYKALEAMAAGKLADSPEEARVHYVEALDFLDQYLTRVAADDRWLGNAHRLKRACERALSALGAH